VFLTEDIADVVAFAAADTPFIIIAAAALLVFSLVFTDVIVYLHAKKKVFLYFVIINSPPPLFFEFVPRCQYHGNRNFEEIYRKKWRAC
jgi:hypothetical protein